MYFSVFQDESVFNQPVDKWMNKAMIDINWYILVGMQCLLNYNLVNDGLWPPAFRH